MHHKFTKRQSRRKKEMSATKPRLYHRKHAKNVMAPYSIKLKADHNQQWNNTIIQARLFKAKVLMNFHIANMLKSKHMSGLKEMLNKAFNKVETNTNYVLVEACNDSDFIDDIAVEVLYGAA